MFNAFIKVIPNFYNCKANVEQKLSQSFSYLKNPFSKATPLTWPDFCGPLVTGLMGFHPILCIGLYFVGRLWKCLGESSELYMLNKSNKVLLRVGWAAFFGQAGIKMSDQT